MKAARIVAALLAPFSVPLFVLLLVLYLFCIQVERGGWWRVLYPVTVASWILDMLLAHTLLPAYMLDWPQAGEWTYSQQLKRLVRNDGPTRELARYVAGILNAIAPAHDHIPMAA